MRALGSIAVPPLRGRRGGVTTGRMNRWLVKTEPGTYSWADLVRDGRTAWTGVANPQAQANLRAMAAGDAAVVYHTGGEKAAVGLAEVVRAAYPDPGAEGLVCVDLASVAPLSAPVTLARLKADRAFAASALVRQGRLSVVPLDPKQWAALLALAAKGPGEQARPKPALKRQQRASPKRARKPARKPAARGRRRT